MTQEKALEILKSGASVFLTGEPGAGKTHTVGLFTEYLVKKDIEYAVTASTGIAASHLDGSTIHSFAALGIRRNLNKSAIEGIKRNSFAVERIRNVKVLIIDEVSMLDAVTINDVSNVLASIHGNELAFGGIQVVFVGDFFQLPPVTKNGEEQTFAFEADAWIRLDPTICYLTEQHRQSDKEFLEILNAMRTGRIEQRHKETLKACRLPQVPDTRLYTHNADVDRINSEELAKIDEKEHNYRMIEGGEDVPLQTLKRQCLSPQNLALKKGATVMFTRNNFHEGYVNGSIGTVVDIKKNSDVVVELKNGLRVIPELATWTYTRRGRTVAFIKQLPLRLAWAITVHKSQGMSLDSAHINLADAFEFGQGYVAISRVRALAGLHLEGVNEKTFLMHPRVIEADEIFRSKGI